MIQEIRRQRGNDSIFYVRGRRVSSKKIERFRRRKNLGVLPVREWVSDFPRIATSSDVRWQIPGDVVTTESNSPRRSRATLSIKSFNELAEKSAQQEKRYAVHDDIEIPRSTPVSLGETQSQGARNPLLAPLAHEIKGKPLLQSFTLPKSWQSLPDENQMLQVKVASQTSRIVPSAGVEPVTHNSYDWRFRENWHDTGLGPTMLDSVNMFGGLMNTFG